MDQDCKVLRYHRYDYRTEQNYCQWILRYISYFGNNTLVSARGSGDLSDAI
jgi:hypothetical protein